MKTISTYQEFTDVKTTQPWVLLFVSASWCSPCIAFSPTVDKVSNSFAKILETVKIDAEQVPEIAQEFALKSVPTLLLFHHGKIIEGVAGSQSSEQLMNWLSRHMLTAA